MNEDHDSAANKTRNGPRYLRAWVVLTVAGYLGLLILTQFLPGGRRSFVDWLEPVLFLFPVSMAAATVIVGAWRVGRWVWRRRVLKPALLVVGGVVALVALFYAEENWRGRHAWNRFKHTWEAKGEQFHLATVVPRPVPDDQNFALTPIAFTSYGQVLTREGKLIPAAKREQHFDVRIRMPLTHDSLASTNRAGDRVKGTFTRLEDWQNYYRELAGQTTAFPVPAQPQSPAADVLLALSKYDGVIEELRAANRMPHSRFPINYDSESPFMIYLPHLASLKSCAQTLQLRGVAALQAGQPNKALDEVRLGLQLADKLRTEPIVISQLVRAAMVQLMLQVIWEGLAQHKWSDAQLAALEEELAKVDFPVAYQTGMRGELAGQSEELDHLRRQPEQVQELEVLRDFFGRKSDVTLPSPMAARLAPAGWFYQNQYRSGRLLVEHFIPAADPGRRIFTPDLVRRGEAALATESVGPFNLFARLIVPWLGQTATRLAYAQASVDLASTAMALERYRLVRGKFPESLDALAPQFIVKAPHDVIGGQPLRYRRTSDSSFILYSVGWNGKDDGGEAAFGVDAAVDVEHGDWIWRSGNDEG
jgi:hypothetical protein